MSKHNKDITKVNLSQLLNVKVRKTWERGYYL